MASNKAALYDKALKFMQKGQWDKSLEFMMQAHAADKSDPHITMKIGDLYKKIDQKREAANYYFKTANIFATQGHTTKAAATYKMILRLDPSLTEVQEKLDELVANYGPISSTSIKPVLPMKAKPAKIDISASPEGEETPMVIERTSGPDDAPEPTAEVPLIQTGSAYSGTDDVPSQPSGESANYGDFGEFVIERPAGDIEPPPGFEPDPDLDEGLVGGTTFGLDISGTVPAPSVGPYAGPSSDMFDGFASGIDAPSGEIPAIDIDSVSRPKDIEFLTDLEEMEIWELLGKMDRLTFGPGEDIIREGDTGDSIYIISEGRVSVSTSVGSSVVVLAELGEQDFFGEVSFLTGRPRTATVTAVDTTQIMELKRSEVNDLISRYPNVEKVLKMFHQNRVADTISTMKTVTKGLF